MTSQIPNTKGITFHMHCASCLDDLPDGMAPQQWQDLEVGWTELGLQVWCKRHDANIVLVDFVGISDVTIDPRESCWRDESGPQSRRGAGRLSDRLARPVAATPLL